MPSTRSTPREFTRCSWRSPASVTCPTRAVRRPQEILTLANAILGQGQLSLAKYLLIVAREDQPALDIHDVPGFLAPPARAGRLADRPAFPDPNDDRHARLLGPRLQPGVEGRDRGGRPASGARCPTSVRGSALPEGFHEPAGRAARHPGRSRRVPYRDGSSDIRGVLRLLRTRMTRSADSP